MLPGMELMGCADLAVPADVMQHVVKVESSFNPYAIGVVGGRLQRQPKTLPEALATARMLEQRGYNFSVGLAQVNRYNLDKQGLTSYERAFDRCANLQAGSRILAECQRRAGDWGKAFSCYYSGNFTTGYRHGYVQKVVASMRGAAAVPTSAIAVIPASASAAPRRAVSPTPAPIADGARRVALRASAIATPASVPSTPVRPGPDALAMRSDPGAHAEVSNGAVVVREASTPGPTVAAPAADAAFVF